MVLWVARASTRCAPALTLLAPCPATFLSHTTFRSQVCFRFGDGDAVDVLRRITQSFPLMGTLMLSSADTDAQPAAADKELADALAVLPDGCWPVLTRIEPADGSIFALPPHAASHLPRLSRCLRRACVSSWSSNEAAIGEALCSALESLQAAESTLQELALYVACGCLREHSTGRAAAALARLRGLRKLEISWIGDGPDEVASLLPSALPALSALSSLAVVCLGASPLPSLSGCPASLHELTVRSREASWAVRTLVSAPQLAGVAQLDLCALE